MLHTADQMHQGGGQVAIHEGCFVLDGVDLLELQRSFGAIVLYVSGRYSNHNHDKPGNGAGEKLFALIRDPKTKGYETTSLRL